MRNLIKKLRLHFPLPRRCPTQINFTDVNIPRPAVYATRRAMASGKKSALLSSLADYGDDSEPDSDPEPEETGI